MKIEKINDNQIRCTLTKEDLASRQLKLSELAYGTEKARSLFQELMQQASSEFGFESEDIPLMIEAVPVNADCLVLIVTRVEDPEELDTRFSRFAPSVHPENEKEDDLQELFHEEVVEGYSDEVSRLFQKVQELDSDKNSSAKNVSEHVPNPSPKNAKKISEKDKFTPLADASGAAFGSPNDKFADSEFGQKKASDENVQKNSNSAKNSDEAKLAPFRAFRFQSLQAVLALSSVLPLQTERNSLYKNEADGYYLLIFMRDALSREAFGRLCNVSSEYGTALRIPAAGETYMQEHYLPVIADNALQTLAQL